MPASAPAAASWNSSERHRCHLPVSPEASHQHHSSKSQNSFHPAATKRKSLPSFVNFPTPLSLHHPPATVANSPAAVQAKLQVVLSSQPAMRSRCFQQNAPLSLRFLIEFAGCGVRDGDSESVSHRRPGRVCGLGLQGECCNDACQEALVGLRARSRAAA